MSATTVSESHRLIDQLEETIAAGDERDCETMLARVADLFMAGSRRYSDEQIALFDDVLLRLSAEIEKHARARLAQQLAYDDHAPPRLMRSFAFDDSIDVARPVLAYSPRLSDADLAESAKSKSQEHLYAIGRRARLNEAVTDVLVQRGNERVVRALATNSGAHFSSASYDRLTARAKGDGVLAFRIVQREDIPRPHLIKLIETASANVRAALEAANPQAAAAIRETVDEIAGAIHREARGASREHAEAVEEAGRRHPDGAISEASVRDPARAQHFEKTVVALAQLGQFPVELVERALIDEGADMVLILAKAARCSWATAKELLLTFSARRTLTADEISRAFASFDKLRPETARRIIDFRAQRLKMRAQASAPDPAKVEAPSSASPKRP